jgi:hypothetical protein
MHRHAMHHRAMHRHVILHRVMHRHVMDQHKYENL